MSFPSQNLILFSALDSSNNRGKMCSYEPITDAMSCYSLSSLEIVVMNLVGDDIFVAASSMAFDESITFMFFNQSTQHTEWISMLTCPNTPCSFKRSESIYDSSTENIYVGLLFSDFVFYEISIDGIANFVNSYPLTIYQVNALYTSSGIVYGSISTTSSNILFVYDAIGTRLFSYYSVPTSINLYTILVESGTTRVRIGGDQSNN